MDWREVARERRIPVWPGAYVWWDSEDGDGAVTAGLWVVVGQNGPEWLLARAEGESVRAGVSVRPGALVLALDHPDTRAAYDRRLALKLGAPADLVEVGAVALRRDNGEPLGKPGWRAVVTGDYWPSVDGLEIAWTSDVVAPLDADPLVARALAWPKEGS